MPDSIPQERIPEVDPTTWRLEAERLEGLLAQRVATSDRSADGWRCHLSLLSESFSKLFFAKDASSSGLGMRVREAIFHVQKEVSTTTTEMARMEGLLLHRHSLIESAKDCADAAKVLNYLITYNFNRS